LRRGRSGFGTGAGTYSLLYSIFISKIRMPTLTGVLNSTVLSLQMPWDSAMMFNYFAVNVGQSARILKQMRAAHHERALAIMKSSLRPVYNHLLGLGLFATSLTVGATVPVLMKKFFSKKDTEQ